MFTLFGFVAYNNLATCKMSANEEMQLVLWRYCNPYTNHRFSKERIFHISGKKVILSQRLDEDISVEYNTGNIVWDGSYLLSQYIQQYAPQFKGKRVIELGAGMGLVGLTAWITGANVTLTELPGKFLDHLAYNVETNVARIAATGSKENMEIIVGPLDWNMPPKSPNPLAGPYDIVLASEILYLPNLYMSLAKTISALCHPASADSQSQVLLVYKERGFGEKKFVEIARRVGKFEVEWIPKDELDPEFHDQPYHMIRLFRKK